MIRSVDLALQVVDLVGADRIASGEEEPTKAAAVRAVTTRLGVSAGRGSSVIHLSYRHEDPAVAVEVLDRLIECYFKKHLQIHRSTEALDMVSKERDVARSQLSRTEADLNKMKIESGVISIEDTQSGLENRRNGVLAALMAVRAEVVEQHAHLAMLEKTAGVERGAEDAARPEQTRETPDRREVARVMARHRDLLEQLALLKQRRNELSVTRMPGDRMLVSLERQIAGRQTELLDLVEEHPELAMNSAASGHGTEGDVAAARARLAALEAKAKALEEQEAGLEEEMAVVGKLAINLHALERRRQMEDENFRYLQASYEKARVDGALNPASMPNISTLQRPSMPLRSIDVVTQRLVFGLAGAGLMIGVLSAFLIEWVVDRRVSRPMEIQTRLQMPLMLSIPCFRSKDGLAKLIGRERSLGEWESSGDPTLPPPLPRWLGRPATEIVDDRERPGGDHFITPYASAIRDRILFNFELNNITHKPKLVGLTGLSHGAGTSTIAAGLARALAEDEDMKVLLVDLSGEPGGRPARHPAEALRNVLELSSSQRFRENGKSLYVVSAPTARNGRGREFLAPAGLYELMPRLQASDFDFIVFDMPTVGPTSPTMAMAGFMDMVLMVLDAENTNRETLSWGYRELQNGRADVSCIFNKARMLAPRWVSGEV